ncbi:MAG TPA: phage portal protein, partial [Rhizobiaceae bacterium]|nr:phage portal protein [Rhizobiaceae bacterium]
MAFSLSWPWRRGARTAERKSSGGWGIVSLHDTRPGDWTRHDYATLARNGFMRNPVAHRAVRMIAEAAAAAPFLLYEGVTEIVAHPLLDLLARPNGRQSGPDLLETLYGHLLLSGNAYLELAEADGEAAELHLLRPDSTRVVTGADGWPLALEHGAGRKRRIALDDERPAALHLRLFHPLDDVDG